MFRKFLKNNNPSFSTLLVSTCNKLNIPLNVGISNNLVRCDEYSLNGAILSGNCDTVKTLLQNGAKLDLNIGKTVSCLNVAISKKDIRMLEVLLEHIYDRSIAQETCYDKEVSKLLTSSDITQKSPLIKAIDLFIQSNNENEKELLKECMKLIYNSPLFNKNNSEFYNLIWKNNSIYFIDYSDRVLNSVENYIMETKNDELIKFFVDNGLNYFTKAILCVNPKLYSHAAMILKFKEPIKFKDSNKKLAGLLYSFESKVRMDNIEPTFYSKQKRLMEKIGSFVLPCDALMRRILLTPEDMLLMEKDNANISTFANVTGDDIIRTVSKAYRTINRLKKTPYFSNVCLRRLLNDLTTSMEDIAYMFSLHTKDAKNFVATDKVTQYDFTTDIPTINIENKTNDGYSIYDIIENTPKQLGLNYNQKISVIEEFLNTECLKILKENNIIKHNSNTFKISQFSNLPSKMPNDLLEKYYYPITYTFDLNLDDKYTKKDNYNVAKSSYEMLNLLEQYNINVTKYDFFENNCITTLKKVLSQCGYKERFDYVDSNLGNYQKSHPQSIITKLKESESNTHDFVTKNFTM